MFPRRFRGTRMNRAFVNCPKFSPGPIGSGSPSAGECSSRGIPPCGPASPSSSWVSLRWRRWSGITTQAKPAIGQNHPQATGAGAMTFLLAGPTRRRQQSHKYGQCPGQWSRPMRPDRRRLSSERQRGRSRPHRLRTWARSRKGQTPYIRRLRFRRPRRSGRPRFSRCLRGRSPPRRTSAIRTLTRSPASMPCGSHFLTMLMTGKSRCTSSTSITRREGSSAMMSSRRPGPSSR